MLKGTPQRIAFVVFLVVLFGIFFNNKFTPFFLLVDFFLRGILFKPQISICFNIAVELLGKGEVPKRAPSPEKRFAAFVGLVFCVFICLSASFEWERLHFFFSLGMLVASGLEAFAAICLACQIYPYLKKYNFEFTPLATLGQQITLFIFVMIMFQFFTVNPFTPFFLVLDYVFRVVLENPNLSMSYNLATSIYQDGKRKKVELTEGKRFASLIGLTMCFLLFLCGYFNFGVLFFLLNFVMLVCTSLDCFFSFCVGCFMYKELQKRGINIPIPGFKKKKDKKKVKEEKGEKLKE